MKTMPRMTFEQDKNASFSSCQTHPSHNKIPTMSQLVNEKSPKPQNSKLNAVAFSRNRAIGQSGNYTHLLNNRVNYPIVYIQSNLIFLSHLEKCRPNILRRLFYTNLYKEGVLS